MTDGRRILLDECVPVRLRRELPGFGVRAVREYGWASKQDDELLQSADMEFDVRVTVDRNLVHQQNLSKRKRLGIVVLVSYSNNLDSLRPLIPQLLIALVNTQPGEVAQIGPP